MLLLSSKLQRYTSYRCPTVCIYAIFMPKPAQAYAHKVRAMD
jgi:hypothetical protein